MPWAKLDDQAWKHDRFDGVSIGAFGLFFACVSYSNCKLLDGHLTRAHMEQLAGFRRAPVDLVDELTRAGLLLPEADGWFIHDYSQYSKSRAQVLAEREENRQRQEAHRQKEKDVPDGHSVTNIVTNAVTSDIKEARHSVTNEPIPYPGTRYPEIPDPTISAPDAASPPAAKAAEAGASKPKALERQMWDALGKALGHAPNGKNAVERGPWNVAIKALLASEETPETVGKLVGLYQERFPAVECTPMALAKHQSLLRSTPLMPLSVYDGPLYRPAVNGTPDDVPLDRRKELAAMTGALSTSARSVSDEDFKAGSASIREKLGGNTKGPIKRPMYRLEGTTRDV